MDSAELVIQPTEYFDRSFRASRLIVSIVIKLARLENEMLVRAHT